MSCHMSHVFIRSTMSVALAALAVLAQPAGLRAESLGCLVNRGNLCFPTGCTNSGKSQRLSLDLSEGTYRLCPNRYSDEGCVTATMQFDIRDTAIVGISMDGPEISARAVFMNRATGAVSISLLAAGLSAADFGTCEISR